MSTGVFGIMLVRNEDDIIEVNLRYHLSLGLERILVVDNGSTDGTRDILARLSKEDHRVSWRIDDGHYHQSQITTVLARESYYLGARWVMPIDADEFWYVDNGTLCELLSGCEAAALRVRVVNFVQRREQLETSPEALWYVTRRVAEPVGPMEACERLVESRQIGYIEAVYPDKWLSRASSELTISAGNHRVHGLDGPRADCPALSILHVPLRSMSSLESKAEQGRRVEEAGFVRGEFWHVRRWWRLACDGELGKEWLANSYEGEWLDVFGSRRPIVEDNRLRDALKPWLRESQRTSARLAEETATTEPTGDSVVGSDVSTTAHGSQHPTDSRRYLEQRVAELEASQRATEDILHQETKQSHLLASLLEDERERATVAEGERRRLQAQLETERRRLQAQLETERRRLQAQLETERRQLQSLLQAEHRRATAATSDFDSLVDRQLVSLTIFALAALRALLEAVLKPRRLRSVIAILLNDIASRLGNRPIRAMLDLAESGDADDGSIHLSGWAYSLVARIQTIDVAVADGTLLLGSAEYGLDRPDVQTAIPWCLVRHCGFAASVPIPDLKPGQHTIVVRISDRAGNRRELHHQIQVQRIS